MTGGGDAPGLNAVIESATRSAIHEGWEIDGVLRGWEGLILGNFMPLRISDVEGAHSDSGTLIQTSRTNPYNFTGYIDGQHFVRTNVSARVVENAAKKGLEGLIVIGGDDTLSPIPKLIKDYGSDIVLVGVPKTMDGDLQVYSLGLDNAINRAKEFIDRFKPVLSANGNIGIIELFGRHVGRVTFKAGIAAGADVILIPEVPVDIDYLADFIAQRYDERAKRNNGVSYVLIAVAEGTRHPTTHEEVYQTPGEDSYGHGKLGGIGDKIALLIQERLAKDQRILRHISGLDIKTQRVTYDLRGGETLYSDSYVGQKLGAAAILAIKNGIQPGMVVVNFNENGQIEALPAEDVVKRRHVHIEVLNLFERFGLYCFGRRPNQELYAPVIFKQGGIQ